MGNLDSLFTLSRQFHGKCLLLGNKITIPEKWNLRFKKYKTVERKTHCMMTCGSQVFKKLNVTNSIVYSLHSHLKTNCSHKVNFVSYIGHEIKWKIKMITFNNLYFWISWRQGLVMGLTSGKLSEKPHEEQATDVKAPTPFSKYEMYLSLP